MTDSPDINNGDFSSMQERNEQTLADIKSLQQSEQDLYNNLETNASSLTSDQKTQIVNKINEISTMRINLYANLKDVYSFFTKNVAGSRTTLAEQLVAIDIIENELNEAKIRLKLLEDEKYNKLRLVEINTYYGKQSNSQADVMKIIVITCIPVIILGIIQNMGIISGKITGFLIALVVTIGVIAVGAKLIDNSNRDKMNYDEYDWNFNSNNAPTASTTVAVNPWEWPSLECVGPACCEPNISTYDSSLNKCIPNVINNLASTSTTETFSNGSGILNYSPLY
jgi:hypothetical protein